MSVDQIIVFAVLVLALIGFAWGRYRYDLVALAAMLACVLSGVVAPADAFAGFANPAVITVAAVLVISQALRHSGIIDVLARRLLPLTVNPVGHVAVLTATVTFFSAFMNNVGALALLMPVALETAHRHGRAPSMLLMPLAFGSLLGGLMTLIGTPPNLIVANYRAQITGSSFAMFDFTPVGATVAVAAVAFIALFGWRLIPGGRSGQTAPERLFRISEYLSELVVPDGSPAVGRTLRQIEAAGDGDITIVGLIRGGERVAAPSPLRRLQAGDILILRADPVALRLLMHEAGLDLVADVKLDADTLRSKDVTLMEAVVTPDSPVEGRGPFALRLRAGPNVNLIAVARRGRPLTMPLRDARFATGDVLLLQGPSDLLPDSVAELGLLPLAERGLRLGQPRQIGLALAIFAAAIAATVAGLTTVPVAFALAVLVYVVLDIVPLRELYSSVDWSVIVLLGAMFPVGMAMENSGATELLAGQIVLLAETLPNWAILTVLLIVTMTVSDVINNAATALIMAPIAAGVALRLGVSVDPFLMAVAIGASSAFLTPIGHQSNTLVMGPGGYRFSDYWRLGLPLEILIVVIAVPVILVVWPL